MTEALLDADARGDDYITPEERLSLSEQFVRSATASEVHNAVVDICTDLGLLNSSSSSSPSSAVTIIELPESFRLSERDDVHLVHETQQLARDVLLQLKHDQHEHRRRWNVSHALLMSQPLKSLFPHDSGDSAADAVADHDEYQVMLKYMHHYTDK